MECTCQWAVGHPERRAFVDAAFARGCTIDEVVELFRAEYGVKVVRSTIGDHRKDHLDNAVFATAGARKRAFLIKRRDTLERLSRRQERKGQDDGLRQSLAMLMEIDKDLAGLDAQSEPKEAQAPPPTPVEVVRFLPPICQCQLARPGCDIFDIIGILRRKKGVRYTLRSIVTPLEQSGDLSEREAVVIREIADRFAEDEPREPEETETEEPEEEQPDYIAAIREALGYTPAAARGNAPLARNYTYDKGGQLIDLDRAEIVKRICAIYDLGRDEAEDAFAQFDRALLATKAKLLEAPKD
jgi:hypothetical protein